MIKIQIKEKISKHASSIVCSSNGVRKNKKVMKNQRGTLHIDSFFPSLSPLSVCQSIPSLFPPTPLLTFIFRSNPAILWLL